jgi:hypothetical protein
MLIRAVILQQMFLRYKLDIKQTMLYRPLESARYHKSKALQIEVLPQLLRSNSKPLKLFTKLQGWKPQVRMWE